MIKEMAIKIRYIPGRYIEKDPGFPTEAITHEHDSQSAAHDQSAPFTTVLTMVAYFCTTFGDTPPIRTEPNQTDSFRQFRHYVIDHNYQMDLPPNF